MNPWIRPKKTLSKPRWYGDTMTCVNCVFGNLLNDEANQQAWYGVEACKEIKQKARDAHAECEDPRKCQCKHIIGLVLTPEEITEMQTAHAPSWTDDPRNGGKND